MEETMTIDGAVTMLVDMGATADGSQEYGRGMSECLALSLGYLEVGEAAQALLSLASMRRAE